MFIKLLYFYLFTIILAIITLIHLKVKMKKELISVFLKSDIKKVNDQYSKIYEFYKYVSICFIPIINLLCVMIYFFAYDKVKEFFIQDMRMELLNYKEE